MHLLSILASIQWNLSFVTSLLVGLSFEKRKDLTWWKAKSSNQDDVDYADYVAADYVDYVDYKAIMLPTMHL